MAKTIATNGVAQAGIEELLQSLRGRFAELQKEIAMADKAMTLSPVEDIGRRIRSERKKQGLTLHELCDLSGVAYATLNKVEQGHPGVRLDSLTNIARALGMGVWLG